MKEINPIQISYSDTKSFSKLVIDYLNEDNQLKPFIHAFPSVEEIILQIERKQKQPIQRELLVARLNEQYRHCAMSEAVKKNIEHLRNEKTFTICTAHQPNIFTGYLYFIYKIIHAINLSAQCKKHYPEFGFVPVYYMGSEDNDVDEIGTFHYQSKTYSWTTTETGACGRMSTQELKLMFNEIKKTLNENVQDELKIIQLFEQAYDGIHTLAEATRIIVNELFGAYGIVVIDGDDADFKKSFSNVMRKELLNRDSQSIVLETVSNFDKSYKLQANPREINLFYLKDQLRERIEYANSQWQVVNTTISFTESEILDELNHFPERFSPNVILRPLYQETLLPNIAFIGGGGELAYWLELKSLFEHHQIVYPLIFLRNSVLWLNEKTSAKIQALHLPFVSIFQSNHEIMNEYLKSSDQLNPLNEIKNELSQAYEHLQVLGKNISPNLEKSMLAHIAKFQRVEKRIEQKVISHLKKQEENVYNQIDRIKHEISPNGVLQERSLNFLTIYKELGSQMLDALIQYQDPLGKSFLVLTYSND